MKPAEIHAKWKALQEKIAKEFDSDTPDLKVILFLIGVQELGKGPGKYSKRQKEELMHIATCRLLSEMGFYELEGLDQDGWPHWSQLFAPFLQAALWPIVGALLLAPQRRAFAPDDIRPL